MGTSPTWCLDHNPLIILQSAAHVYYSNYTYSQLYNLVSLIVDCCENPLKHHSAVYDKYCDKRFKRASLFVESEMKKGFQLPSVAKESTPGVARRQAC